MPPAKLSEGGRVERLVSLAYLLTIHDEIAMDELEERFSLTSAQIEEDLNQLMFCGLPPYSPDQLFDISIEDGFVSMYYNDVFVAPLKLNDNERTNATIALTRLKEESNLGEKENIDEILNVINSTTKQVIEVENSSEYNDLFQKAIEENLVAKIIYLSLNSGTIEERLIDPKKILTTASSSYIHAYCHRDNTMKLFRTDRISSASLTNDEAKEHETIDEVEVVSNTQVPFVSSHKDSIVLKVNEKASWILDSYPHEIVGGDENLYKFEISNSFVGARLFLTASPYIEYVSGTISKDAIKDSIETIRERIS